jgi:glyoxylase-like metal-dependent hydrolase (beta-lactamase superfamily II)
MNIENATSQQTGKSIENQSENPNMLDSTFESTFLPITSVNSGTAQILKNDIYCFTNQIVNICLIGDPNSSEECTLVDAGMPHSVDSIVAAVRERFGDQRKPNSIVLTHGHFDHVGSLVELVEKWDIPVYAHELEIPYLTGEKDYPPGDPTVDGGLVSEMSPMFPHHGINVTNFLKVLPSDGRIPSMPGWRWIHTPGHTPGHVSFFRDEDRTLVVGDAFVTVKQESLYKVIMQEQEISGPPKYFTTNWTDAWDSVKKLEDLKPLLAITGHGLPMGGEVLSHELAKLARDFESMAIPGEGR